MIVRILFLITVINREEKVLPVQKDRMERMERTENLESQYVVKYFS